MLAPSHDNTLTEKRMNNCRSAMCLKYVTEKEEDVI